VILAVVAAAAAARLFVVRLDLPALTHDSYVYISHANGIRAGVWQNVIPNGYPLLLALLPFSTTDPHFIAAAQAVNVACGAGTSALTALTALRLGLSRGAACAAGLLVALWPHQVNYARLLLSESVAGLLLALAVWALLAERRVVSGGALGVLAITRTVAAPLFVLMPLVASGPWRKIARSWIASLAIVAAFAAAAMPSGHLGLGSNLSANIEVARLSADGHFDFGAAPGSVSTAAGRYAHDAVADPARFLRQRLQSVGELWGPWPLEHGRPTWRRVLIGMRFPFVLLAIVALLVHRHDRRWWIVATPPLTLTAIHFWLFSTARHSQPVEPQMLLLSVTGIWWLTRRGVGRVPDEAEKGYTREEDEGPNGAPLRGATGRSVMDPLEKRKQGGEPRHAISGWLAADRQSRGHSAWVTWCWSTGSPADSGVAEQPSSLRP
jgi:hypothetical protein